uniref:tRNA (uracil-O(2)-)-methyltransferase n=1 Tax=Globodera rostochiensis TaxID=31243 RepID=A0A914GWI0_GLORO
MNSAKFEWKIVAESELWLTQPCASVVSQLFQIWWRLCASVNRRIACTRFLNEQNAPLELFNEILANLSPISADLESKLWRGSDIMQLIPKSHFHKTFSDRCFEVAEFGGDGQKEFVAIFRSAQLPSRVNASAERSDGKLGQNPHISGTYAFYLANNTSTPTESGDDERAHKNKAASLKLLCHCEMSAAQMDFLHKWVWPRLQKWANKIVESTAATLSNWPMQQQIAFGEGDNRLLHDLKAYTDRYWRLKLVYGPQQKNLVEKHCSLNFECSAIAAYLLELWNIDGVGPKRGFVDLHCGRGLLAHLLQMEGVPGVGVHSREKAQWAAFKSHGTRLVELPQAEPDISMADKIKSAVPEVDFLIGNRCDKMIPWIPIIAAKLRCNFFLLPNIPTSFYSNFGKRIVAKYEDLPSGRLEQFYAFLEEMCKMLGFDVATDHLKIPSKRRKCLIGIVPLRGLPNVLELDKIIAQLLSSADASATQSKKRHLNQRTNVISMSDNECFVDLSRRVVSFLIGKDSERKIGNWHCGGSAKVEEIAKCVLNDQHRRLLSGVARGLRTFLNSQRQLLSVSDGTVSLRFWPSDYQKFEQKIGREKVRNFQCLFQQIHPDGCPLEPKVCPYKHAEM